MYILWYVSAEKAPVCITPMSKHNLSTLTINTGGQSEVRKAIKEGEREREEEEEERWTKEKGDS